MVEITTLGNFMIKVNGSTVTDRFKKTSKLFQLLYLLITSMNKPIPNGVICDAIWKKNDTITHKALQNLVYRMRCIFADSGDEECVVYNHKTYMLVPGPSWKIDVHLMEDYYIQALSRNIHLGERIKLLEKAADLYCGEYMVNLISDVSLQAAAANRYKRMFVEIVCLLSDYYMEADHYEKMFALCERAIALEPLQEPIYIRMARGLRDRGKAAQAIKLIEDYFDVLYQEMGLRASNALNSIYNELKSNGASPKHDVGHLLNDFREISTLNKALYCNLDAFKDIYRYESRHVARRKHLIHLALIELSGKDNENLPEKNLLRARRALLECCMMTLRRGDVFADYSRNQIVVMFTLSNESDSEKIISRLSDNFYSHVQMKNLFLKFDVQNATMQLH